MIHPILMTTFILVVLFNLASFGDARYSIADDVRSSKLPVSYIKSNVKSNVKVAVIPSSMKHITSKIIWAHFNNPTTMNISNIGCRLNSNTVSKLEQLEDDLLGIKIKIRIRNCYVSNELQQKILANLNKSHIASEYGSFATIKSLMQIDRSGGNIIDIELLDMHGNKLIQNKYLNIRHFNRKTPKKVQRLFEKNKFKKITKYPWIWQVE